MELPLPKKARTFLSMWATISFSSTTLINAASWLAS
jgi:hypothetical protein